MPRQLVKSASEEVGEIRVFPMVSIPSTYLACQGQAINRTTYSALFAKIGTTYGAGDGVNTFNVPNCQGKFLRGLGGNSAAIGVAQADEVLSHNHTQNSHNHTQDSHNHTQNSHGHSGSTNTDTHTHNNQIINSSITDPDTGNSTLYATSGTRHAYPAIDSDTHGHTPTIDNETGANIAATATNIASTAVNQNAGGVESRPKNTAVVFGIKY